MLGNVLQSSSGSSSWRFRLSVALAGTGGDTALEEAFTAVGCVSNLPQWELHGCFMEHSRSEGSRKGWLCTQPSGNWVFRGNRYQTCCTHCSPSTWEAQRVIRLGQGEKTVTYLGQGHSASTAGTGWLFDISLWKTGVQTSKARIKRTHESRCA